jgi:hypothetical protein
MHAADLRVKQHAGGALRALAAADEEAASAGAPAGDVSPSPSREQLKLWLDTWRLSPMLDGRRLDAIDALVQEELSV